MARICVRFTPVVLFAFVFLSAPSAHAQQCSQLVWSDEFSGSSLDLGKWEPMIGDGCDIGLCGWGNSELQWYLAENATVSGGTLKITAKKQRVRARQYTSARLRTLNLGDWTYGRFEARIKVPAGQGLWPAFWMLPTDEVYGGWPQSGEIDILETKGQSTDVVYGTIHFGDAWPGNRSTGSELWNRAGFFSDGFHVYAIEWEPNEIRWYLDDRLYGRKIPDDLRGHPWPFDQRFHILMNMAVGGTFVGNPDDSIFPQDLEVDYVRVYDTRRPTLEGPDRVGENETGAVYSVVGESGTGSSYSWSVPPGASIVSGQGSSSITVDFGTSGGNVSVALSNSCLSTTLAAAVFVEPPESVDTVYEDFESNRLTLTSTSGTLDDAAHNPDPSGVNTSSIVGHYVRDIGSQYDTIVYAFPLADASVFRNSKRFYMDLYTTAPVGTHVTVQLENSSVATGDNFPSGRHSSYLAKTSVQNQWERLAFDFNARWDGDTPDNAVDQLIILYDGGWFTGDTYYYDNLSAYAPGSGPCTPATMHVAGIAVSTVNAGQGQKRGQAQVTIADDCGESVSAATVTGTFTGDFNETIVAATNGSGVATATTSGTKKGSVSFTYCADSVSHGSLAYDPGANVETCRSL